MRKQLWLGLRVTALALVAWTASQESARAVFIVSPDNQATSEGNINRGFPFNVPFFGLNEMRYQQVYRNSDFASLSGPMLVTQIAFRPDAANGNAFSATFSNIQISLSTTSKAPDGLSTTFAQNLGTDSTLVLSGPVTISSMFTGPVAGPKAFDILFNLQTPFLYDPSKGNLLLEVKNFGQTAFTSGLNAEFASGDSVSRLYNADNNPNGTSGFTDTLGAGDAL